MNFAGGRGQSPLLIVGAAIAVVTYSLDLLAVQAGALKLPLAMGFTGALLLAALITALARKGLERSTLFGFCIWLAFLLPWLLSCWFSHSITEAALRILTYSTVVIALGWLCANGAESDLSTGLLIGLIVVTAVGFYRFLTLTGGEPAEHLLGYWGIKYLPSTRNGDTLYPLLGFALSLSLVQDSRKRPWAALLLVLFGSALVLSSSRGAWLVMVLLILLGIRSSAATARVMGVVGGVFAVAALFLAAALPDLNAVLKDRALTLVGASDGPSMSSNEERLLLLSSAGSAAIENWLGAGIGNFGEAVGLRSYSDAAVMNHAENLIVTVAVEQGLLGFLVYLAASITLTIRALGAPSIASALATVAVGHSLFNYELNSWLYWAIIGLALLLPGKEVRVPGHLPQEASGALPHRVNR